MGPELLVDNRIEEGRQLLAELTRSGFDVSVAFWAKMAEENLWLLYIGSTSVEPSRIGDAYRALYACLSKIPDPVLSLSEVQLLQANDPIAKDAIAARDRQPGRLPVRVQGKRLGNLLIEDAYIYPKRGGTMTPGEILQALIGMANRPNGTPAGPAVITLRDGTTTTALITGFDLKIPGGLTIRATDMASQSKKEITGDEVVNIQSEVTP